MNSSNSNSSYHISTIHCRMILTEVDPRQRIRRGYLLRKNLSICLTWKLKILVPLSNSARHLHRSRTPAIKSKSSNIACGMPLPNLPWHHPNNWYKHSNKWKPINIIATIYTTLRASKVPKTCSMKWSKSLSSWPRSRPDVIWKIRVVSSVTRVRTTKWRAYSYVRIRSFTIRW